MPHMIGHWYDVVCDWCGARLRVHGPRPVLDADPVSRQQLGPCPVCAADPPPAGQQSKWRVPTYDTEITSPEHLQQLIDQGHQDAFAFGAQP